jgi:hypothetical protein
LTLPAASLQDFDVLRYKPGQHYHCHMDTFDAGPRAPVHCCRFSFLSFSLICCLSWTLPVKIQALQAKVTYFL